MIEDSERNILRILIGSFFVIGCDYGGVESYIFVLIFCINSDKFGFLWINGDVIEGEKLSCGIEEGL